MIADLHCHYPMHLLPEDRHPHGVSEGFFRRLKDDLDASIEGLLGRVANDASWDSGWRVDLDGLEQGGARLICSVLFWPPDEFDFDRSYGSPPGPGYFSDLQGQLQSVESNLQSLDPAGARHLIVRRAADLDDAERLAFVHCVEGGFHLGPDQSALDANVQWLAQRGVIYVTLAHLFFRGVATNAPAIPALSDSEYRAIFHEDPDLGLTALGQAAVRAMYTHKVLVDISHMSERAIGDTFDLIESLDRTSGADPLEYPVIATHVGMRSADPDTQSYNLSDDTARRIQERGGLIGLIMAQHQLGTTDDPGQSRAVLKRHIDAVSALGDGLASCAIGTDLDGFIKPTLSGIERCADLRDLEAWIRDEYPADADAILHDNARRVLRRVLAARS
jgi:microsomal dipeptidase-like Zn-dependent dipeptidase